MNLHRPPAILKFIGHRAGKLTVIGLGKKIQSTVNDQQHKRAVYKQLWRCKCDCGKEIEVPPFRITHNVIKSCGCGRLKSLSDLALHRKFNHYRLDAAKKEKKKFLLTFEEFKVIVLKDCVYCGSAPCREIKTESGFIYYNGMDRIDSMKGYTIDNTVPCCTNCNMIKWVLSKEDFLNHIEKILIHQKII